MTDQPRDLAAEVERVATFWGERPEIKTLLQHIAALSREFEEATQAGIDTAREISDTLTGRIDELEAENERLQTAFDQAVFEHAELKDQLTALRRPVGQSETLESRPIVKASCDTLAMYGSVEGMAADILADALIVRAYAFDLLSQLDAAQREIQRLKDTGQKIDDELVRTQRDYQTARDAHDQRQAELNDARAEIARLSSPPQERADIQERHAQRSQWHRSVMGASALKSVHDDIDVLLQDLALARNARHVYQAERELHQARKDEVARLMAHNAEYCKRHLAQLQRIERLEATLDLARMDIEASHAGPDIVVSPASVEVLRRVRAALAASQDTAGSGDCVAGD